MIELFIKYIILDYCIEKMFTIIDENITPFPLSNITVSHEEWSIDIGEKFKTIVTMRNGIDSIYHNCKILDNDYSGIGWKILIGYDNFTEQRKYLWISYQEIYKMIR